LFDKSEQGGTSNIPGKEDIPSTPPDSQYRIAGLNCHAHGGPKDPSEMIYWEDIPLDSNFVSPFASVPPTTKYLTFEADEGGWNNIRMAMETAVTLAFAMGRTLVMPPQQGMYLIDNGHGGQKRRFTFTDFFPFDSIHVEHKGFNIISMEQFLKTEVMTGTMLDKTTGLPTFPPYSNRTNWNDIPYEETQTLNRWFRTFAETPDWNTDICMVGIPAKPGPEGPARLENISASLRGRMYEDRESLYVGHPVSVDANPRDRLDEALVDRQNICVYNETYQAAKVIHMMGDGPSRMLVHFYAFVFMEDWKQDLWIKRFVRDHIRYADAIQCPAARVVQAMRNHAKEHGDDQGIFDTLHIRRGDFQFKETRINATEIYNAIQDLIPEGTTVFIATDERDVQFFEIFQNHYHVYFLKDFPLELRGVNTNFYGMIDQRVASRGRTFIGCHQSTFTGYINRMRGYHSQKDKVEGWEQGAIPSYYYVPLEEKYVLRKYSPLSPPLWAREFPKAWRDLNHGIEDLAAQAHDVSVKI
jgi:GDP-fucose protein O-fucosyltransferase